jgi:phospholipase/carboxylesterase
VVTGFSQGAMLSYAVIARPEARVFAALPIAGLLPRELWPEARPIGGLMPGVYAFHGAADARDDGGGTVFDG